MADDKKKLPEEQRDLEMSVLKDRIAELELEAEAKGGAVKDAHMLEFAQIVALAVKEALRPETPGDRSRPKPRALSPEHKGTKTYIVGPSGHWRNNRLFKAGELVTITDQRPARDWKLAPGQDGSPEKSSPPLSRPAPAKRASDTDVA